MTCIPFMGRKEKPMDHSGHGDGNGNDDELQSVSVEPGGRCSAFSGWSTRKAAAAVPTPVLCIYFK